MSHSSHQYLTSCLPKYLSQYAVYKDELTVFCAPQDVLHVLRFLKDHSQCLYRACMDITAVDYPTRCEALPLLASGFDFPEGLVESRRVLPER
jgi:NADH dehydrogenase (ubiquinone) Fe-S protein 3